MSESDNLIQEKIKSYYVEILEREPDSKGVKHYLNAVKNNQIKLSAIPGFLMKSQEYENLLKNQAAVNNYSKLVKKPIFIIGVPRSGTTFLYRNLCLHPHLSWLSHFDLKLWLSKEQQENLVKKFTRLKENHEKIPHSEGSLFVFGTEIEKPLGNTERIPIEGDSLWRKFLYSKNFPWGKNTLSSSMKIEVIKIIFNVTKDQKKSRFLNKAPQHSTRLNIIQEIFPDTKFIHIFRDPRAVISSMMERVEKEGRFDTGVEIQDKNTFKKLDNVQKWAWQYKEIIDSIHEFSLSKNNETFYSIKYEELIKNPTSYFNEITKFCELESFDFPTPGIHSDVLQKWREKLTEGDERKIFDIVNPSLKKINCEYQM